MSLTVRMIRLLPPEPAHAFTLLALKMGFAGADRRPDDPSLHIRLWDREFTNPLGMAAGFDKNAEVIAPLLNLGLGHVEVGTLTPRAQDGNPKPRLYRWEANSGVVNRMGFNNQGLDAVEPRLKAWRGREVRPRGLVGVNIGKNRDSADAVHDYVTGIERVAPYADYIAINVSSPNTPGLRELQKREHLEELIRACLKARAAVVQASGCTRPPLLVKIAPDLDDTELEQIVATVLETREGEDGIDGLIATNTALYRPEGMPTKLAQEEGGLSGQPMFDLSTEILRKTANLLKGQLPIIGVGGVMTADDAYAKIKAGASLIQIYTGMIYRGTPMIHDIKKGLVERLHRDGFSSLDEAVGVEAWKR